MMLPLSLGPAGRHPRLACSRSARTPTTSRSAAPGTLLKLIEEEAVSEIRWVVLSGEGERAEEARRSAEALLDGVPTSEVVVCDFPDGFFPYEGKRIKDFFEGLKADFSPDVVFTHQRADLHQDHRVSCELTWNTFRDHLILEYEVPKYDGDMSAPNAFVPLSESALAAQDRPPDGPLRIPALQALVPGGPVLEPAAAARHGVQLAELPRRGVLLPQGRAGVNPTPSRPERGTGDRCEQRHRRGDVQNAARARMVCGRLGASAEYRREHVAATGHQLLRSTRRRPCGLLPRYSCSYIAPRRFSLSARC